MRGAARRGSAAASSISGALLAAATPVVSFVALPPEEYGTFSLPYLFLALGLSIQFSVVTDAWTRTTTRHQRTSPVGDVFGALLALTVLFASVSAVVLALIPVTHLIWGAAGAIAAGMMRNGLRYVNLAQRAHRRVLVSDLCGLLGFAIVVAVGIPRFDPLIVVTLAWATSGVTGLLGLHIEPSVRGGVARRWLRDHRSSIRTLVADSTLMDIGGIGTPLLLAPLLGIGSFGVYRGISNVGLPVRLVLDPLRPIVGSRRATWVTRPGAIAATAIVALILGAACFFVLAVAVPAIGVDLGTLSALEHYALPSGVFVGVSFVSHLYYIVCRSRLDPRRLIYGRIGQTIAAIVLPLAGVLLGGLVGAIWGFVLASAVTAAIYAGFGLSLGRRGPTLPESPLEK